jgi:protein TonB
VPDQVIVAPGSLTSVHSWDDYLPMHRVSQSPVFDERAIMADLVYPPIALRSAIEGRVILELFVDKNGRVQQIRILQETPGDRGFGEAAVRAFAGRRGTPAYANGEPVSSRYSYPVSFRIR